MPYSGLSPPHVPLLGQLPLVGASAGTGNVLAGLTVATDSGSGRQASLHILQPSRLHQQQAVSSPTHPTPGHTHSTPSTPSTQHPTLQQGQGLQGDGLTGVVRRIFSSLASGSNSTAPTSPKQATVGSSQGDTRARLQGLQRWKCGACGIKAAGLWC